jgi:hypothetical protein
MLEEVDAACSRGILHRGGKPLPHRCYLLFVYNQTVLLGDRAKRFRRSQIRNQKSEIF